MSSSALIPVKFELNIPDMLARRGYDRRRVEAMHIAGDEIFRHETSGAVERTHETELPELAARGIASVLTWGFGENRPAISRVSRMNCFLALTAARGWVALE